MALEGENFYHLLDCLQVGREKLLNMEYPDVVRMRDSPAVLKRMLEYVCPLKSGMIHFDFGDESLKDRYEKVAVPRVLKWVKEAWEEHGPLDLVQHSYMWPRIGKVLMEVVVATDTEQCPVCLNALYREAAQPCTHRFHTHCLDQWKSTGHNTCPLCRGSL